MNELAGHPVRRHAALIRGLLAATAGALLVTNALGQLAQRPLLVTPTGAKPNLMITLDNSGSMAMPMSDDYHITRFDQETVNGALAEVKGGHWMAMRSSEVNPLYYNPRITYLPRVDATGAPLPISDDLAFVSNQNRAAYAYWLLGPSLESFKTTPPRMGRSDLVPSAPWELASLQYNALAYSIFTGRPSNIYVPVHVRHTTAEVAGAAPPAFSYVVCNEVKFVPGFESNEGYTPGQYCNAGTTVNVVYGSTATIPLPANHQRTDCGPAGTKTCTTKQEIANILMWFRYHRDRMSAATTALGRVLSDPRLNDKIRVGYMPINLLSSAMPLQPGVDVDQPQTLRGVRNWRIGSSDNRQLYDWLYGTFPIGGTPLHNAIDKVGAYLRVPGGAKENPWARDPSKLASATNPELSCRRSYHMLFSDGGWTGATATNVGKDHDNLPGPEFKGPAQVGTTPSALAYSPAGSDTDLQLYVPYPSAVTGTLSDLSAQYYWHEDLREGLDNEVPTEPGKPTFWQNMTTYTVGYMIKPSGMQIKYDGTQATTGLTFEQIDAYRKEFLLKGKAATPPKWPKVTNESTDLPSSHVDDFIQAGFTGGGRSFSVYKTEELLSVFNSVLAEILNASGSDAGVALGYSGGLANNTPKSLKFGVDYSTAKLTGDVHAKVLNGNAVPVLQTVDASGNPLVPPRLDLWRASQRIPGHANRRVFSIRADNTGFAFTGPFSALPVETRGRLQSGPDSARIPGDSRFVDYLRGKDPVLDEVGNPFRYRPSPLGAIVNAPPLFVGAVNDRFYDASGDVSGKSTYRAYRDQIKAAPGSLFVATNAGAVHALSANTGDELAAFMPLRSMSRLLGLASNEAKFSYVLDGPLTVHDVLKDGQWNQLVIGTGGRGEKLVYALRSPLNTPSDRTPGAKDFLWESGPDIIDKIDNGAVVTGHMTNPLVSGQTDDGHWVVIANNGHYNGRADGAKAGLVVLDAATGAVLRTIPLPSRFSAGRGLGGVSLVQDVRRRIVAAYAGDANGNLWRFNLRGLPSEWAVAYDSPLFTSADGRPIYGTPTWKAHPSGGYMVIMATGMLLEEADLADTQKRERIYGIWDPTDRDGTPARNFTPVAESELLVQEPLKLQGTVDGNEFFSLSKNQIDWKTHRGWTLALGHTLKGERALDPIYNLGSSVVVNTTVLASGDGNAPESCAMAGLPPNFLYVLNAIDGAGKPAFDTDGDGKLNDAAMVFVSGGGFSRSIGVSVLSAPIGQGLPGISGSEPPGSASGGSGNSTPGCVAASVALVGTGATPINTQVICPSRPWSRQQYELSRVPQ